MLHKDNPERDHIGDSVRRAIREAIRNNAMTGDRAADAAIERHLAAQFGEPPAAIGDSSPIHAGFKEAFASKHAIDDGIDWSWDDATDIAKPIRTAYTEFKSSTDPIQCDVARSFDDRAVLACRLGMVKRGGMLVTCVEATPQTDEPDGANVFGQFSCGSPEEVGRLIKTLREAAPTEALELGDLVVPYDNFWKQPIVTALIGDGFQISRQAILPARSNGARTTPKGQVFSALKIYYYVMMQRNQPAKPAANEAGAPLQQQAAS
jgi:hypothetical protein